MKTDGEGECANENAIPKCAANKPLCPLELSNHMAGTVFTCGMARIRACIVPASPRSCQRHRAKGAGQGAKQIDDLSHQGFSFLILKASANARIASLGRE